MLNVTFYGVRGSTPCAGHATARYGGNTSCVVLERPGALPIIFDIGTGLRYFGDHQPIDGSFAGVALVTHLHWDHVMGLPFFVPVLREGASLDLFAPAQLEGPVHDVFDRLMRPPYFPVQMEQLPGRIQFHDAERATFTAAGAEVLARPVPHVGPTNGYRVNVDGLSVAYVSDHQQPLDGSLSVDQGVLELADGVDLLIHDAQFTPAEFAHKAHWGHCTVEYALHVAREAGAKRLVLFHHDPVRHDDALDDIGKRTLDQGERVDVEVIVASEATTVQLGARDVVENAGAAPGTSGPAADTPVRRIGVPA